MRIIDERPPIPSYRPSDFTGAVKFALDPEDERTGRALMIEEELGIAPAFIHLANDVVTGDPYVIEEHFV